MSVKIGLLIPVNTPSGEELHGEIQTLQMQLKVKLQSVGVKRYDTGPDYRIYAVSPKGDVQIGNAWKKIKQQIGDVDTEFLSITIDDPSFPHSLFVYAFKNETGGWDIVWRRRLDKAPASNAA